MPAPDRPTPTRTDSTSSWAYTKGLVGHYTDSETDAAIAAAITGVVTGGTVDLNGYATEQFVTDAIAAIPPASLGGERPAVFESGIAPVGDLKDGDLWLSPATVNLTIRQLSALTLSDASLAAMRQSVIDEVRKVMAGGKTLPADIDWTPCTKVAGSGLIEARVLNGMIQLRGEVSLTVTATGTFVLTQRLPANFPKPPRDQSVVAFGYEAGVSYRRVFVRFYADGGIGIVGDGKITGTELTGAQAYAY